VVAGRVGGSASTFAMQRLGCDVSLVPSVLYPVTPAPGAARGSRVPQAIFDLVIAGLADAWLARLDALHIGYLRTCEQAASVARLIGRVRGAAPKALVMLDPILGDEPGGLYVPREAAEAVKSLLIKAADIATPNRFELGYLAGVPVDTEPAAMAAARRLGPARVVVTSAPARPGQAATLLVEPGRAWRVRTPLLPRAPHGTGDLLSGLFLARLLAGEAPPTALAEAVASVQDLITLSHDELAMIEHQERLVSPLARLEGELIA
jgi:pyridoxine kinase